MLRARPDLVARLLMECAIAIDKPCLQSVDDHRRGFVEARAGFVHAEPERGDLAPGETAREAEAKPALAQHSEHRRLFGDAQWVVPREDDGGGAQIDIGVE